MIGNVRTVLELDSYSRQASLGNYFDDATFYLERETICFTWWSGTKRKSPAPNYLTGFPYRPPFTLLFIRNGITSQNMISVSVTINLVY